MQRGSRDGGKRLIEMHLKERTVVRSGKGFHARPANLFRANPDRKLSIRGGSAIRDKHSDSIDGRLGESRRHRNDSLGGLTGPEDEVIRRKSC